MQKKPLRPSCVSSRFTPGDFGVDVAAEIIELALHDAAREQEANELRRIADVQVAAQARVTRLLNVSPAVIYCRKAYDASLAPPSSAKAFRGFLM